VLADVVDNAYGIFGNLDYLNTTDYEFDNETTNGFNGTHGEGSGKASWTDVWAAFLTDDFYSKPKYFVFK
jgi:hypothetical protein